MYSEFIKQQIEDVQNLSLVLSPRQPSIPFSTHLQQKWIKSTNKLASCKVSTNTVTQVFVSLQLALIRT